MPDFYNDLRHSDCPLLAYLIYKLIIVPIAYTPKITEKFYCHLSQVFLNFNSKCT